MDITFNKNNNKLYYNTIIECTNGILKGTDGTFVEVK